MSYDEQRSIRNTYIACGIMLVLGLVGMAFGHYYIGGTIVVLAALLGAINGASA